MKRIYVAGNYSRNGDGSKADVLQVLDNMRLGMRVTVDLMRAGYAAFCPFLDFNLGLIGPIPEGVFKANSIAWLMVSDAMLVLSGEGIGHGVDAEIAVAKQMGIEIYRGTDGLKTLLDTL